MLSGREEEGDPSSSEEGEALAQMLKVSYDGLYVKSFRCKYLQVLWQYLQFFLAVNEGTFPMWRSSFNNDNNRGVDMQIQSWDIHFMSSTTPTGETQTAGQPFAHKGTSTHTSRK